MEKKKYQTRITTYSIDRVTLRSTLIPNEVSRYKIPGGDSSVVTCYHSPLPVRQFMLGEINGFIRASIVPMEYNKNTDAIIKRERWMNNRYERKILTYSVPENGGRSRRKGRRPARPLCAKCGCWGLILIPSPGGERRGELW